MAGKIAGITIEIGGDTKPLSKALKNVNSSIKDTQRALKDVEKLLKLDPTNTELLQQKQKLLKEAVSQTAEKLETLKKAQAQMDAAGVDKSSEEYQALQREIIATEQDLKAATKAAKNFSPALEKIKAGAKVAADGLKDAADKTRKFSAAAAGALTSIAAFGYKAITNSDDLNTLAKQTGFTTEQIQKMQYAADRIDVSFEDISGALKKFKGKIDPSNKSLQKLGVSTTNADGSLRSATEVFMDAVSALSGIENETEKDQLAMELFGKSADSLAGIIDDGGEALKTYGEEASNLGLIMDQETLDSLNSINDEIDKLKAQGLATFLSVGAKAVEALSPVIEKVAEAIASCLEWISSLSPETLKIVMIILAAVAALSPLLSLLASLATAIAFLASPIGIAIAIITALIAVGVLLYKNWDTIKAKAAELVGHVKTSWNNIKTAVTTAINNAKTTVSTAWNTIKTTVVTTGSTIWSSVVTSWNNIKTAITKPIETAKTTVSNAIETIKGLFPIKLGNIFSGIKLPHFKIDGGELPWGVGGMGKAPSISVTWYKKAMNQPYLLDGATIFGAMNGKLLGGGEAGKEVIMSYDQYKAGAGNVTINVYASQGMSVNQLADKIQDRFVALNKQRRLSNA